MCHAICDGKAADLQRQKASLPELKWLRKPSSFDSLNVKYFCEKAIKNEIRIIQRIGNIVAHQISSFQTYEEGFAVDKSVRPARFIALRGLGDGKAILTREDIQARRQRTRAFIARRVDWEAVQRENTELGRLGEKFVVAFERTRVAALDPSSVDRVLHLSRLQGDGLGYDISSVNPDGSIRRIEVKTTRGGIRTPFYMSRNERLFLETYQDDGAFVHNACTSLTPTTIRAAFR